MAGNLVNRMAIYGNRTAVDIVEPHKKIDKSSFTTAGRSYNGNTFTGICLKIEVFNQFLIRYITEAYVVNIYFTFYVCYSFRRIWTFRISNRMVRMDLPAVGKW